MTFRPRKKFAQHWLKSEIVLDQIISSAQLKPEDSILEIGPGTGILTRRLLEAVKALVSVEIDEDLCKKLVKNLGNVDNFLLLKGDFLTLDLTTNLAGFPKFQNPHKVVANIPYNITGPILEKLLGTISQPKSNSYELIVILIQKEVAERLTAKPSTKAYSSLSVQIQYLAECELISQVSAKCFYPVPKVDSAIVRLIPRTISTPAYLPQHLQKIIKLGFANRRKMLKNNLKSIISLEDLTQLLSELNINIEARAENLSLQEWINLSNKLCAPTP